MKRNEQQPNAELATLDYYIRRYTNTAQVHWDMAEHFSQSARELEMLALEYTERRNALLEGLGNVAVLGQTNELGGIA